MLPFALLLLASPSAADLRAEMEEKIKRVQSFLVEKNLGGIMLSSTANFSWITAGLGDNHVVITSETGAASILVLRDGSKFVFASQSEMPRLMSEDLRGLGFQPVENKWHESLRIAEAVKLAGGRPVGSDTPMPGLTVVSDVAARMRVPLTESELAKYRWLGKEVASAVAETARAIAPGMTERQIEAMASDALMKRGIRPTVLLIGVDDRNTRFRHTVPSDRKLERYAFINVCARKWGLVVSTGRHVHFGPPPADLVRRSEISARLTARFLEATKPNVISGSIIDAARNWFAEEGVAGELDLHHQGGAIGYAEREWIARPGAGDRVVLPSAFAWNPIIDGALSFDTFLVFPDYVENIAEIAGWPSITARAGNHQVRLPAILVRPAPVSLDITPKGVSLNRSFYQSEPLQFEVASSADDLPRPVRGAYSSVTAVPNGYRAIGSLALTPEIKAHVTDVWSLDGEDVVLQRGVTLAGPSRPGGFVSSFTLNLPEGEPQIFVPGMIYGGAGNLTTSAIGGAETPRANSVIRIREDRMPAPVFAVRMPDGAGLAILDAAPDAATTAADSLDTQAAPLVDGNFRVLALGAEFAGSSATAGAWFPASEGQVTYAGNTYPGGQMKQWRRRYHPLDPNQTHRYALRFRLTSESSFRAFYRDTWRWAWSRLKPAYAVEDLESARRAMTDVLDATAEKSPQGLTGIPNFIDAVLKENRRFDRKAVMGFTGKNLESAEFLLLESLRDKTARGDRLRKTGLAIFDSFVKLKMNPPAGEGFHLETGESVLAIPRDKRVYLRSFGDDLKATLRAYAREKRAGIHHSQWLAWVKSFADWLLTQQQPSGGFPRAWEPGAGAIVDASPNSSYNAVPMLVLLARETGDRRYLDAAVRAGEFVWSVAERLGVFVGGTIDNPDVIDKEAGTLSLEAYLALFDATGDAKWQVRAAAAADFAETWIYVWNVPMPADDDNARLHWKRGVPTIGLQLISSGHSLVDDYMAFDVDEYARLYRLTGDDHYRAVAHLLLHSTKAMLALPSRTYDLAGPGWQQEHWSLAPRRGYGLHRGWLPWVATSQLNGIAGLEETDPALFAELSVSPPPR